MTPDARLESELGLADLVDHESLARLCRSFADASHVAVRVVALDGRPLLGDAAAAAEDGQGHDEQGAPAAAARLAEVTGPQGRFLRARVNNGFEPLGYLLAGPFAADAAADRHMVHARACLQLLMAVLEQIVRTNYTSYLTAKTSLQRQSASPLIFADAALSSAA